MTPRPIKRRFDAATEREIRRAFFKGGKSAAQLRATFGPMSDCLLTRILGQSPGRKGLKIENVYC